MFENPFGTNLQDLQQNYYQQLAAMQQMQQKQGSSSILEEINKVVSGMSSDEQAMMSESPEYIMAKQTYEAGFMGFLGQKFSQEYVNTQEGKTAANNLLNSIKRIKDKVSEDLKAKQKKVDELIHLLENDPELKKRYEELSIQVVEKYIKGIASNFFGFSTLPAQTVVTYVVRNWVDKHNGMIDLFVDKDGNINAPLIADALKSELKARGGFTIGRVKFSDSDVDELLTAFNQAKQKNR